MNSTLNDKWELIKIKLNPPIIVGGDGSSIWGESKGEFQINRIEVELCVAEGGEEIAEKWGNLEAFGPKTRSTHYTDAKIEHEIKRKLKSVLEEKFGPIKEFGWSEHGMQPEKGWNFDITFQGL
jgi:hypothetical protein